MTTKCPDCGELLDPEETPGVRFGKKPGWIDISTFGKNVDLVDNTQAAYFHPDCSPARFGYIEGEIPPHP